MSFQKNAISEASRGLWRSGLVSWGTTMMAGAIYAKKLHTSSALWRHYYETPLERRRLNVNGSKWISD